ncbi:MAG TPA: AMP-binding protein [Streptosporangiaceae bacterium]|nr:AMP-binding protein [Streptosporangiaceae bacterium]
MSDWAPYHRFEFTVSRARESVAVDLGSTRVQYGELGQLVARAAARIALLDLPPQSRVGLLGAKELSTYVCYLAILRLRHTVVPLSLDGPVAFHEKIARLADLRCVILSESRHRANAMALSAAGVMILDSHEVLLSPHHAPSPCASKPEDVAYILFTSGSTGVPKGVPITNSNISAYLDHVVPRYELGPGCRLSHTFALTFDPSVFDLFGSWTSGATVVVPRNRELLMPARYVSLRGITHWYSVPSLISYAIRIGELQPNTMPNLRWSQFAGEPLAERSAAAWRVAAPNSLIENVYGPTELTITCSDYRIPPGKVQWEDVTNGTVPIGSIYEKLEWLLIRDGRVVDDEGELCVRGAQRFQGYLDRADNAGRFVRSAGLKVAEVDANDGLLSTDWYRTGDRIRVTQKYLIHMGRVDRQIKLRGYRIELGDVEGAIKRHPAVLDGAVIVVADGESDPEMVAVICAELESAEGLREFLSQSLPAYMIPSRFKLVAELPVNGSGKTDYRALTELACESS